MSYSTCPKCGSELWGYPGSPCTNRRCVLHEPDFSKRRRLIREAERRRKPDPQEAERE